MLTIHSRICFRTSTRESEIVFRNCKLRPRAPAPIKARESTWEVVTEHKREQHKQEIITRTGLEWGTCMQSAWFFVLLLRGSCRDFYLSAMTQKKKKKTTEYTSLMEFWWFIWTSWWISLDASRRVQPDRRIPTSARIWPEIWKSCSLGLLSPRTMMSSAENRCEIKLLMASWP